MLGVIENRALRKMLRIKRDEMTGERRKLHNDELHDVYFPLDFVWATSSKRLRRKEKFKCNLVLKKSERESPLRRPRRRWENKIKISTQN
jgi:hypothetical protein